MKFPKDKDQLADALHQGIDEVSQKIDELKVQASLAKAETRQAIQERLDSLHQHTVDLRGRIKHLKSASGSAAQDLAEGCKHSFKTLRAAVEQAIGEFKS